MERSDFFRVSVGHHRKKDIFQIFTSLVHLKDAWIFVDRIEQELLARIVSEMNQPVPDPTTLTRPQAIPESSTASEPEEEDADMLGEFFLILFQ